MSCDQADDGPGLPEQSACPAGGDVTGDHPVRDDELGWEGLRARGGQGQPLLPSSPVISLCFLVCDLGCPGAEPDFCTVAPGLKIVHFEQFWERPIIVSSLNPSF